jgi:polyhydroxyalkanoic acid synthase PhaR subunit
LTQKISFEPFTMWKDMYEHTEKAWSDVIQDTLGKESFSEGLGQIQSSYLQYQEMINNLTEVYFKQANIPTPDEIANVAALVINLEEKIDTIDDQLYENSESSSKEINQLKRTISKLEKKFDKILEAISALDNKLEVSEISSTTATSQSNTKVTLEPTPTKPDNTETN